MINIRRRRILIVEDDIASARNLAECLPCFEVDGADTFRDARRKLVSSIDDPYSAIILDLQLPDAHGSALAAIVHDKWTEIPIIVVTGMSAKEESSIKLYRAGAQKILRKPYDPEELRQALLEMISKKEASNLVSPARQDIQETKEMVSKLANKSISDKA